MLGTLPNPVSTGPTLLPKIHSKSVTLVVQNELEPWTFQLR